MYMRKTVGESPTAIRTFMARSRLPLRPSQAAALLIREATLPTRSAAAPLVQAAALLVLPIRPSHRACLPPRPLSPP